MSDLIKHRWNVANGPGEIPLSRAEFAQIYQQSNGVPGKAIVLARQIEILNANAERKSPDPALRYLAIGGALIVVFLLFAFFNADNPTETQDTQMDLELPSEQKIAPTNLIPLPLPTSENSREIKAEATLAPLLPIAVDTELPEVTGATITPQPAERETEPLSQIVVERVPDPIPLAVPSTPPAIANPATRESQPPSDTKIKQEYSIEWLRSRPRTGYVLQLFGVRDRAAAKAFIKNRDIGKHSDVLVTELSGQPWYVVVYKYYPDRDSAQGAITKLPPNLAGTKPWARPIESLR